MRKPIIAGNWKMNKTPSEGVALVKELLPLVADAACDVVVCPPFVDLPAVGEALKGSNVHLGAQNIHFAEKGAYTGEVSADMLKELGVEYVIIGHSERREYFAETDETVNKKVLVALEKGFTPIMCCGETLEQREAGITEAFVSGQVEKGLAGLTAADLPKVVIAYEPIWAIGHRQDRHERGSQRDHRRHPQDPCPPLRRGGRPGHPHSIRRLHERQERLRPHGHAEIDGGLIGGASLKAEDFSKVVHF